MPSYDSLDNVSWAEFRIRLFAFNRTKENELETLRLQTYMNMIGTAYAFGGKIPNIDKFWKLDTKKDKEKQNRRLNALRKARKEFLNKKNGG